MRYHPVFRQRHVEFMNVGVLDKSNGQLMNSGMSSDTPEYIPRGNPSR